jgi:hypothetical protein
VKLSRANEHHRALVSAFGARWLVVYTVLVGLYGRHPFDLGWTRAPILLSKVWAWYDRTLPSLGTPTQYDHFILTMYLGGVLTAAVGALVWLALDRSRKHEAIIRDAGFIAARFTLAAWMLGYGGQQKVRDLFAIGPVEMSRLFGEVGGYVFDWVGYSPAYDTFAALMEYGGALLLFFRRTALLGALMAAASLVMVMSIIFEHWGSFHVFAAPAQPFMLAIGIIALESKRLLRSLLLDAPTVPVTDQPYVARRVGRPLAIAGRTLVAAYLLFDSVKAMSTDWKTFRTRSPLAGIYAVDSFSVNGRATLSPSEAASRWRIVAFDEHTRWVLIRHIDDTRVEYTAYVQPEQYAERVKEASASTVSFSWQETLLTDEATPADRTKLHMTITRLDEHHLAVEAVLDSLPIRARLRRIPAKHFPLANPSSPIALK